MSKKQEIINVTDNAITKGNEFLSYAKDFVACLEILLIAATGLKQVFEKDEGGVNDEQDV